MTRRPLHCLFAVLLGLLAGCSTINSRIRQKTAVFDRLSAADQAKIRQGVIAIGFTPDMVYMALGKPDVVRRRTDHRATKTIWIYNSYYDRYVGTARVGYRRFIYWDAHIRAYRVHYEPAYRDIYRTAKETFFRITFEHDKVTVIEQTKA